MSLNRPRTHRNYDPKRYPHNDMTGRDGSDTHPISAISGLEDAIEGIETGVSERVRYVANMADFSILTGSSIGDRVDTNGYTTAGDGGGNQFVRVADTGQVDNGGTIRRLLDNSVWEALEKDEITLKQWGAIEDYNTYVFEDTGMIDNSSIIQNVIEYCEDNQKVLDGENYPFYFSGSLSISKRLRLKNINLYYFGSAAIAVDFWSKGDTYISSKNWDIFSLKRVPNTNGIIPEVTTGLRMIKALTFNIKNIIITGFNIGLLSQGCVLLNVENGGINSNNQNLRLTYYTNIGNAVKVPSNDNKFNFLNLGYNKKAEIPTVYIGASGAFSTLDGANNNEINNCWIENCEGNGVFIEYGLGNKIVGTRFEANFSYMIKILGGTQNVSSTKIERCWLLNPKQFGAEQQTHLIIDGTDEVINISNTFDLSGGLDGVLFFNNGKIRSYGNIIFGLDSTGELADNYKPDLSGTPINQLILTDRSDSNDWQSGSVISGVLDITSENSLITIQSIDSNPTDLTNITLSNQTNLNGTIVILKSSFSLDGFITLKNSSTVNLKNGVDIILKYNQVVTLINDGFSRWIEI